KPRRERPRPRRGNGGEADAGQEGERQEREAVRGPQGQGHVEGARGEDRELAGLVEQRREIDLTLVVVAGRNDGAEEGGRPQGRARDRAQALAGRLMAALRDAATLACR